MRATGRLRRTGGPGPPHGCLARAGTPRSEPAPHLIYKSPGFLPLFSSLLISGDLLALAPALAALAFAVVVVHADFAAFVAFGPIKHAPRFALLAPVIVLAAHPRTTSFIPTDHSHVFLHRIR